MKKPLKLRTKKEIMNNLGQLLPGIKEIGVLEESKDKVARVIVELPWWKWLGAGLIHLAYRKRLERLFIDLGVAGVLYIIDVR